MTGLLVLVVDDNAMNLRLVQVVLQKDGFEVRTASSGTDALAILETVTPAIALLDLQLPGMSGFELAKRLRDDPATRDIVLVAVTAYAMKGDEQKALDGGFDGYISKPIDTKRLGSLVRDYIANGVRART